MAATELNQTNMPAKDSFEREWRQKTKQFPVTEGQHLCVMILETSVKLTGAHQTVLEDLVEALAQGGVSVVKAKSAFVATVPAPPTGHALNAELTGRFAPVAE